MFNQIYSTFADLLVDAREFAGLKTWADVSAALDAAGKIPISRKVIWNYGTGISVPPLEKAMALLDALSYDYSQEELIELLEASKKPAKDKKDDLYTLPNYENPIVRRTVVVSLKDLVPDDFAGRLINIEDRLDSRVEEVCGDRSKFSAYVTMLIRKDFYENILTEGDFVANGN